MCPFSACTQVYGYCLIHCHLNFSVLLSYPNIFVLSLFVLKSKLSAMLIHLFSESRKVYVDAKGASVRFRTNINSCGWCKFWKPLQWASLATDHPPRVYSLSLVFHKPSSTNLEFAVSFRWRTGVSIGESHSKRRKEKEPDPTWPENPEVMLCRILRTYWIWLYGGKKQQSWSKKPVNDCHCLCGCDSYWSSNSSKNGNISQVVINIVSARKPIVLFCAGSCQVEL